MHKKYIVDTNVLLDDSDSIRTLINGEENTIYIPKIVLNELDKLKKDSRLKTQAVDAIKQLNIYSKHIKIIDLDYIFDINDDEIIACAHEFPDTILVTNDEMMHFKCSQQNIKCEKYKRSIPFQVESEKYTGILDQTDTKIYNSFYWNELGKLIYHKDLTNEKILDYDNIVWNIKPRTIYQNAALELLLKDEIDLVTIQSEAGFGKTYLALAAALYSVLEKHKYDKILIVKPNIDAGQEKLGFLPGDVSDKIWPYFHPIYELLIKLHKIRPANKIWKDGNEDILNDRKIEFAPINFMRGRNIENCFCIIDEFQNFSKLEARTILSRMGENVKCVCLGDVKQIDNIHLTEENNALNWVVKLCKNKKNYGHITLKGTTSRGPIADLVRKVKL